MTQINNWRDAQKAALEITPEGEKYVIAPEPFTVEGKIFWTVYDLKKDDGAKPRLAVRIGSNLVIADNGKVIDVPSSPGFDRNAFLIEKYSS